MSASSQQPSDQPHMGTAFTPAKTSPASWDAFNDVDAFVDAVLAELAAMAGTRPTRSGPKPPLTGAALHLAVDKYGFPLAITVSPANVYDSKGIVPVLRQLAGRGFKGTALGDLSYRGGDVPLDVANGQALLINDYEPRRICRRLVALSHAAMAAPSVWA